MTSSDLRPRELPECLVAHSRGGLGKCYSLSWGLVPTGPKALEGILWHCLIFLLQ